MCQDSGEQSRALGPSCLILDYGIKFVLHYLIQSQYCLILDYGIKFVLHLRIIDQLMICKLPILAVNTIMSSGF